MSWLEKTIAWISPEWAAHRDIWRARREAWSATGYRSGRPSRLGAEPALGAMPDYHLESGFDRESMVARSMQLERDNSVATGLLTRNADNVVSAGILPQAATDDEGWNKAAEELFDEWAESGCDVRGMSTFWELQKLAQYQLMRDGDVGAVLRADGDIQLVESIRIAAPVGWEVHPYHIDGIDITPMGRPSRYHIVPRRPDEIIQSHSRDLPERVTVEAKDMLFMARRSSASQTRGTPALAQSMEQFEHLDRLLSSVVVSARIAACFGLLIESPIPGAPSTEMSTASGLTGSAFKLEPGLVRNLLPGQSIKQIAPAQPTQQLDQFVTLIARILGLPVSMPLELILLDFSKTNYSSARAALLEARRSFVVQQDYLISRFCRPVWRWKIRSWIEDKLLPPNPKAMKHDWIPPGWPWIDPLKEIQAAQLEIDAGLRSRTDVVASQGRDYKTVLQALRAERKAQREAGLPDLRSTLTRDPMPVMAGVGAEDSNDD